MKIFLTVMLALCLAGCSVAALKPSGAGNTVYSQDIAIESKLQEAYSGILCRDNGLPFSSEGEQGPRCSYGAMSASHWTVFVNAGLYDIDRRCDDYLDWLYQIKRSRGPIQKQMTRTANLTESVLKLTGAADFTIELVGLAFGYALDSWTDVADSLLFNMEYSTVQKLVYDRQRLMKEDIFGIAFTSRPQALHALRGYLRVCMPYTIETDINTSLVAGTVTGRMSNGVAEVSAAAVGAKTATDRVDIEDQPKVIASASAQALFLDPTNKRDDEVRTVQSYICAPKVDGIVGEDTRRAVHFVEDKPGVDGFVADGKLNTTEYVFVKDFGSACDRTFYRNVVERQIFGDEGEYGVFVADLKKLFPDDPVPEGPYGIEAQDDIRNKLSKLRNDGSVTANSIVPKDELSNSVRNAIRTLAKGVK